MTILLSLLGVTFIRPSNLRWVLFFNWCNFSIMFLGCSCFFFKVTRIEAQVASAAIKIEADAAELEKAKDDFHHRIEVMQLRCTGPVVMFRVIFI